MRCSQPPLLNVHTLSSFNEKRFCIIYFLSSQYELNYLVEHQSRGGGKKERNCRGKRLKEAEKVWVLGKVQERIQCRLPDVVEFQWCASSPGGDRVAGWGLTCRCGSLCRCREPGNPRLDVDNQPVEVLHQLQLPVCFGISRAHCFDVWFEGLKNLEYLSFMLFHISPSLCVLYIWYSHRSFKRAHDLPDVPRLCFL